MLLLNNEMTARVKGLRCSHCVVELKQLLDDAVENRVIALAASPPAQAGVPGMASSVLGVRVHGDIVMDSDVSFRFC